MRQPTPELVEASAWADALVHAMADGFDYLDHLTVVDRIASFEVMVELRDSGSAESRLLLTTIPIDDPRLACACRILAGADWHEREAAELFGIEFEGHGEIRPLLTRGRTLALRKQVPLIARLTTPWPGAEGNRRSRIPGVLDTWQVGETQEGDRT